MKSEYKTYQIRYNTVSVDEKQRWRIIENGKEQLVSDIFIDGYTYTTKDWISEINDYKWHISCEGFCEIIDNVAYIKTKRNGSAIKRHLLKTITWRIVGTIDTIILSWIISGNPLIGLSIGGAEVLTKMALYYLHERVWYKSDFVKKNKVITIKKTIK